MHMMEINKRRTLTRIFAFLAIVCFDINSNIRTTKRIQNDAATNSNNAADDQIMMQNDNHIHIVSDQQSKSTTNTNNNNDTIRISFQLHDPTIVPFQDLFSPGSYGCKLGISDDGKGVRTGELPPSFLLGGTDSVTGNYHGRVLDFTTTISNSLKLLHIGDSVTLQMSEALDEMMGAHVLKTRKNLWEAFPGGEGGTLVSPTWGGGMHGAWRITALWSQGAQGGPDTKNKPGGGWNYHQVNPFKNHKYKYEGKNMTVDGKLDAIFMRVMHGWMSVEEITRERIIEAAEMAHKILGAETIIFLTVPFTNNVLTPEIYRGVSEINEMIWDIAINWHRHSTDKTTVLVMDYAQYSNHIIWQNARHLGYQNVSDPVTITDSKVFDREGPNFILQRLNATKWNPSIAQVCDKMPPAGSNNGYCDRNFLIADGMHFCAEIVASRVGAALACLLGCVYNKRASSVTINNETIRIQNIRSCEHQCNKQFMSVMPITESWINTTLASFPD